MKMTTQTHFTKEITRDDGNKYKMSVEFDDINKEYHLTLIVNNNDAGEAIIKIEDHMVTVAYYRCNQDIPKLNRFFTYTIIDNSIAKILSNGKMEDVIYPIIKFMFIEDTRYYEYHFFTGKIFGNKNI
jgi:hypothetical protein